MASLTDALIKGTTERVSSAVSDAKDRVMSSFDPTKSIYNLGLGVGPLIRETVSEYRKQQGNESKSNEKSQLKETVEIKNVNKQANKSLQNLDLQMRNMNKALSEIRKINLAQLKLQSSGAKFSSSYDRKTNTSPLSALVSPSNAPETIERNDNSSSQKSGLTDMLKDLIKPLIAGGLGAAIIRYLPDVIQGYTGDDGPSFQKKLDQYKKGAGGLAGAAVGAKIGSKFGWRGGVFGALSGGLLGYENPEAGGLAAGAMLGGGNSILNAAFKDRAAKAAAATAAKAAAAEAAAAAPSAAAKPTVAATAAESAAAARAQAAVDARKAAMEADVAKNVEKAKFAPPTEEIPAWQRKQQAGGAADWKAPGMTNPNPTVQGASVASTGEKIAASLNKTVEQTAEAAKGAYATVAESAATAGKVAMNVGKTVLKGGGIGGAIAGGFDYYQHGDATGALITGGLSALGGVIGMIGGGAVGTLAGPVGTAAGGVAGSIGGSMAGEALAERINQWRNPSAYKEQGLEVVPSQGPAGTETNNSKPSGDLAKFVPKEVLEDKAFMAEVQRVSDKYGISQADLLGVIKAESGFRPDAKNPGSSATGLLQFIEERAKQMGTTTAELRKMSRAEQMKYVDKYFSLPDVNLPHGANAGQIYTAVFAPARNRSGNKVMYKKGSKEYEQNSNLDTNRDDIISIDELAGRVAAAQNSGPNAMGGGMSAGNGNGTIDVAALKSMGLADADIKGIEGAQATIKGYTDFANVIPTLLGLGGGGGGGGNNNNPNSSSGGGADRSPPTGNLSAPEKNVLMGRTYDSLGNVVY